MPPYLPKFGLVHAIANAQPQPDSCLDERCSTINPGTIANNMCHRNVIDQVEAAALANGDRRLHKVCVAHMDIGASTTATATSYS